MARLPPPRESLPANRSTARGHAARFSVNFGVAGGGQPTANPETACLLGTLFNLEIPAPSTNGRTNGQRKPVRV